MATAFHPGVRLLCALLLLAIPSHAESLQIFAVVFGRVTNDIAIIESNFDNAPAQKRSLAFQATPEGLATSGTFFVQRDRNEIYGVFSVAGSSLEVKDGRFRIQLPRELRGKQQ